MDLTYLNGQYGVFLHVDKDIEGRKMRAFSFASPASQEDLYIATYIGEEPSSFKHAMKNLTIGDTMTVDGPMGNFTWDEQEEAVFVVGGIGITPVASIIAGKQTAQPATILYSDASENYVFTNVFNRSDVSTHYTSGVQKTKELIEQTVQEKPQALYYVVGGLSFVGSITMQLESLGITKEQIKLDRFTGY
jgi:ferredoxin-NADP reductase